jgi:hypothetical protein
VARAILTDIEGTTSSIAFVKDVLFPYARRALPGFVAAHGGEPEMRRWLGTVAEETGAAGDDAVIATLQGWLDQDQKHTALKALQGMIWRDGYQQGAYTAHVYDDAAAKLRAWHAASHPLYVYSSGSVAAQRLFFGHSTAGDLRCSPAASTPRPGPSARRPATGGSPAPSAVLRPTSCSSPTSSMSSTPPARLAWPPCSSIAAPTTGSRAPAPPPTATPAPSRSPRSTPADSRQARQFDGTIWH